MNLRRFLCVASVFAGLTAFTSSTQAIDVSEDSYAAIAYAPSTGNYRYSYNYGSRYSAEQAALRGLTEKDAKIVCWVNRGFCALALGDDVGCYGTGWTYGDDASNTEAMDTALTNCREHTKGARIVLCLVSDGQYIYHPKPVTRVPPAETAKATPSLAPFTPPGPSLNPNHFNPPVFDAPFLKSPLLNPPYLNPPNLDPTSPLLDPNSPLFSPNAPRFHPNAPILIPDPTMTP